MASDERRADQRRFTSDWCEMIIINLSHTLDVDHGFTELSQDHWNAMFDQLMGIKARVVNMTADDYSAKTLNDYIANRPAVLLVVQLPDGITLGNYASQGFVAAANFPIYDSYSDSNDARAMANDQLQKLQANRYLVGDDGARKDGFHLLSWTMTQQAVDVVDPERAIMNLAVDVYDDLFNNAYAAFTPECFPNVLYIDAYGVRDPPVTFPYAAPAQVQPNWDVVALAMAVNNGKAGHNPYITGAAS